MKKSLKSNLSYKIFLIENEHIHFLSKIFFYDKMDKRPFYFRVTVNTGNYGPEKPPYLNTFQALILIDFQNEVLQKLVFILLTLASTSAKIRNTIIAKLAIIIQSYSRLLKGTL